MKYEEQDLSSLGARIKTLRKEKGVSLSAVGKAIGISHNFLSEVENGKKEPSSDTLRAIAKYFEIDEDELFNAGGKVPLRTMEFVNKDPGLQKLLSEVQRKYGDDPNKMDELRVKISKMYQDFLNEEE